MNVLFRKIPKRKERKQQSWRKVYKVKMVSVEKHK